MKNRIRGIARVLSFLLVGLVVLIFLGEGLTEGFPNPAMLTLEENLGLGAFFLMVAGLVVAWKREGGALLTVLGYALFCMIRGEIMWGLFFLFPVTAILFVACWYLSGTERGGRPTGDSL